MQIKKSKIAIFLIAVILFSTGAAIIYATTNNNTAIEPDPTPSPTPKPLEIEVKVIPWGDMYRKEPDTKTDFNVELVYPNENTNFTTNTFNVIFNAGAFFWVVERAYYTSDLFTGEKWIEISKTQYTVDLQKTFTFNLTNVPQGTHYLTLTVVFHEGTRNNATAVFNVSAYFSQPSLRSKIVL